MNPLVLLAALAAIIIFGASPVAAKIAVQSIHAMDVATLRTIIGGAIALPLTLMLGIRLPKHKQQRGLLLLSGVCGFVGFPILFTLGVQITSANHASMILATLPIITGGIAMLWDKQVPTTLWWLGCFIALTGEGVLIFSTVELGQSQASIQGDLLVLCSNLFAALGYVADGRLQRSGYSAKATTFWGVSLFAIILLPVMPLLLHFDQLPQASLNSWLGVLYLGIGVTVAGYIFWYWALGSGGIARVGLLQFLQPISGVILAGILLNEQLSFSFIFASIVILSGVWVALKGK